MSTPGFFLYTGDWIKDTRVLDVAARGAWIDILCVMAERDGSVTWPLQAYEQYWGLIDPNSTQPQADSIIAAFKRYNICEVVTERNGDITLRCRRMTRDLKGRENNKKRQQRFRKKDDNNASVTEKNTVLPSPSLNPSPSSDDSDKNQNPDSDPPSAAASPDFLSVTSEKKRGEKTKMASQNLSPELKAETDRLYGSDPKKFQRVIIWVNHSRKHGYTEPDMAEALRQFWDYRAIDDWYPYLDEILLKVFKNRSARESEAEHRRHLAELKELGDSARNGDLGVKPVLSVVRGLADAKKA